MRSHLVPPTCMACEREPVSMPGMKCIPCADAAVAAIAPRLRAGRERDIAKEQERVDKQNAKALKERMKKRRGGPVQTTEAPFVLARPGDPPLRCMHAVAPTGACRVCHPQRASCP